MRDRGGVYHRYGRVRLKTSSELVSEGTAMPVIRGWITASPRTVEVLPCGAGHGDVALEALQVTARSPLGAIAFETGGLLVDSGWIRVLGAGSAKLARTIAGWNGLPCDPGDAYLPGAMFVADDVLGGMYAIDVGALGSATPGNICYFAPGTLAWRDTGLQYGDWLKHILIDPDDFYVERWERWEADVRSLPGTHAFFLDPAPWQPGPPFADRARRAVTMRELRDAQLRRS
jgi:hypothetical protein